MKCIYIYIYIYIYINIGSRCSSGQDVVFVIDSSCSYYSFQSIKEFTANVTTELFRNSFRSAVAVILFNYSVANIQFNLQAYTSLNSLLSAINQLPYYTSYSRSGIRRTNTAEALTLLLSSAQNGTLGLRNDSLKIAIVITDAVRSRSGSATRGAATRLHTSNIFDVFAVGIGVGFLFELERYIASRPEFVFTTNSFTSTDLQQLQRRIATQLCNGR